MYGQWQHRTRKHEAEDLHWRLTLHPIIEQAEYQFRVRLSGGVPSLGRHLRPDQVETWLRAVTWNTSFTAAERDDRTGYRHATAHYPDQRIVFNILYLRKLAGTKGATEPLREGHRLNVMEARLLDLTLHELGHLADWYFYKQIGHGETWRRIGRSVGYVTNGELHEVTRLRRIKEESSHLWAASSEPASNA